MSPQKSQSISKVNFDYAEDSSQKSGANTGCIRYLVWVLILLIALGWYTAERTKKHKVTPNPTQTPSATSTIEPTATSDVSSLLVTSIAVLSDIRDGITCLCNSTSNVTITTTSTASNTTRLAATLNPSKTSQPPDVPAPEISEITATVTIPSIPPPSVTIAVQPSSTSSILSPTVPNPSPTQNISASTSTPPSTLPESTRTRRNINACGDTIDNDGDGLIDWPFDPQCQNENDNNESQ